MSEMMFDLVLLTTSPAGEVDASIMDHEISYDDCTTQLPTQPRSGEQYVCSMQAATPARYDAEADRPPLDTLAWAIALTSLSALIVLAALVAGALRARRQLATLRNKYGDSSKP
jgi:hypothetical protein